MQFKDIIGQEVLKQSMVDTIRQGRVSHAQLFLGPLGHGGLPLALAYAQYLACTDKGEHDSCGTCPSCIKAQKLIHPDIHFSFPFPALEGRKTCVEFITEWREVLLDEPYLSLGNWLLKFNAENKQANIPITECRDIIRRLNLRSFESEYKVMIIWLPEFLGKEGNTLLKILEEPPDNTVFLLVAEKHDQILNTILSRTQMQKIHSIEIDQLAIALAERFTLSSEDAMRIAGLANGNYIEASILAQHSVNEQANLFREWVDMLLGKNDPIALVNWVDTFAAAGREGQKNFFSYGLHLLEELTRMNIYGRDSKLLNAAELQLARRILFLAQDNSSMQEVYKTFNEAHYYVERNAHPKILMLNLSVKLGHLFRQKKVTLTNI
jgi:DNA polymerase-3 subunit delta'